MFIMMIESELTVELSDDLRQKEEVMIDIPLDSPEHIEAKEKIKQALHRIEIQLITLKEELNEFCPARIYQQFLKLINADFSAYWTAEISKITTLPDDPITPFLFSDEVSQYIKFHNQLAELNQIAREVAPVFKYYTVLYQFVGNLKSHQVLNYNSWIHIVESISTLKKELTINQLIVKCDRYEKLSLEIKQLPEKFDLLQERIKRHISSEEQEKTTASSSSNQDTMNPLRSYFKKWLVAQSIFGDPVDGTLITLDMQKSFIVHLLEKLKDLSSKNHSWTTKSSSIASSQTIWIQSNPQIIDEKIHLYPLIEKLEHILDSVHIAEKADTLIEYDFFSEAITCISQSLETWCLMGESASTKSIPTEENGSIESTKYRIGQVIEGLLDSIAILNSTEDKAGYRKKYGSYNPENEYIYQYINRMTSYLKDFSATYLGYERHAHLAEVTAARQSHTTGISSSSD